MPITQVGPGAQIVATPRILSPVDIAPSQTATTTQTAVTGSSISFSTYAANALVNLNWVADIGGSTTGWGFCQLYVFLDGTEIGVTGSYATLFDTGVNSFRQWAPAFASFVVPSVGSHTITYQIAKSTGSGTVTLNAVHSQITVFDQLAATTQGTNFPALSAAPANPGVGQGYYNTTSGGPFYWNGSVWAPMGAVGNPAGRVYYTGSGGMTTGTLVTIATTNLDGTLKGGMTQGSSGLVVPVAGWYQVNGQIKAHVTSGSGTLEAGIFVSGSALRIGSAIDTANTYPAATVSDIIYLTASQYLNLGYYFSGSAANVQTDSGSQDNYLSAYLVSQ